MPPGDPLNAILNFETLLLHIHIYHIPKFQKNNLSSLSLQCHEQNIATVPILVY